MSIIQELDKRIREEFPHKFQQDSRSSARAPVAGATRSSGKPSNKKNQIITFSGCNRR